LALDQRVFGEPAYPTVESNAVLARLNRPALTVSFSRYSERKLMDCMNRLGYDIEIKLKPASAPVGHLMLKIA
jgi:hypothetical protein